MAATVKHSTIPTTDRARKDSFRLRTRELLRAHAELTFTYSCEAELPWSREPILLTCAKHPLTCAKPILITCAEPFSLPDRRAGFYRLRPSVDKALSGK